MLKIPSAAGSSDAAAEGKKGLLKKAFKQDKFSKYFEGKGLTVNDLPKAIICHELLGIFMLALTWSTCYFFPPSQNRFLKEPIAKMISMVPKALSGPVTNNAFLSSRIGTSYLESSCIRKLIRPMTLPSKLYLTYKLVQVLPKFDKTNSSADHQATVISPVRKINTKAVTMRGGYSAYNENSEPADHHSYRSYEDASVQMLSTVPKIHCEVGDEFRTMSAVDTNAAYNVMKLKYRVLSRE